MEQGLMAIVSNVLFLRQSLDRGSNRDFGALPTLMSSPQIEIEEETTTLEVVGADQEKIYVAVGKDVNENCKSCLLWASKNFGAKSICILHVHQPPQLIPCSMGGKFSANKLHEQEVKAYRDLEKGKMHKILNEYLSICAQHGVLAEILYIEMENIEKGIVELVAQHGIKRLVMGSTSGKNRGINMVKSKKAIFVSQQAHESCNIWFICKGCLVQTREGVLENCKSPLTSSCSETSPVNRLKSRSITEGQSAHVTLTSTVQKLIQRARSHGSSISTLNRGTLMSEHGTKDVNKMQEIPGGGPSQAKGLERLYYDLIKQKKGLEVILARNTLELNRSKKERDKVVEELKTALAQKKVLESQIADLERMLVRCRQERDKLQVENDKRVAGEATSSQGLQFSSNFSFSEIRAATRNFDPSLIIGEGGYGTVYKGFLRNTDVAIKLLNSSGCQGCSEFKQEVDILSRMRHPNLVTLIGTCSEAWSLVYEYLPNGNLQDRLACKDNTSPLSWQTRIRIAVDICSALTFLHSNKPHGIVHGDLKPANILLDSNLISKLGDFGISRFLTGGETSTMCYKTDNPKGTLVYIDPQFLSTGELTPKSDVYSFGIILLQLLTGRPPLRIAQEVQQGFDGGSLSDMLDISAGNWPIVQAKQIACIALKCCELNRQNRPDLISQVWRVLEPMKRSSYRVD